LQPELFLPNALPVAQPVMLVLGLKAKFCGLGLAIGWPWPYEVWPWQKIQGQNLGRLQNSPLTFMHWSTVTGVNYISRFTFLTYLQWATITAILLPNRSTGASDLVVEY